LLPKRGEARSASSRTQLARFLGLEAIDARPAPADLAADRRTKAEAPARVAWPSQTEVAASFALTRARIGQVIGAARERWAKHSGLNRLRDDIARVLADAGGVMTAEELCSAVL